VPRGLALAAVTVTVLLWGSSGVLIKLASTTGLVTALYRLWFAIPLLWSTAAAPSVRARLDRDWLRGSLVGGTLFAGHQMLFFSGLKLTTVTDINTIGALQPVLVLWVAGSLFGERATARAAGWSLAAVVGAALVLLVAAPLFGEPVSRSAIGWAAIAVAGTGLVVVGSHGSPGWSPLGDAIAVVNLFAFTAYFLASKRIRERTDAWTYVLGMTTVAGIVMLGACLATRQDLGSPHRSDWIILAAIAVLPGTLGHVLMNWAHAYVSAFAISMMLLGVPVVGAFAAAAVLGEPITLLQVVGGALVLIAIANVVLGMDPRAAGELAESAAETDAP
jgi:drug/metabolite transporter (DMT)-like permease